MKEKVHADSLGQESLTPKGRDAHERVLWRVEEAVREARREVEDGREDRRQSPQTMTKYLALMLLAMGSQLRAWIEVRFFVFEKRLSHLTHS